MPELPEVEVTRLRLEPDVVGMKIVEVVVRAAKLRLPVPEDLPVLLSGLTIVSIRRRGKYLLFDCGKGFLIVHLGMTGYLRVVPASVPMGKHDHLDLVLDNRLTLRFHDPRKFGTILWVEKDPLRHPLLVRIGPEPLSLEFDTHYLYGVTRHRTVPIKLLVMNAAVVAGIGNIYANEALFRAGIRPDRPAASLTLEECDLLTAMIREVLEESIQAGSTFRIAEGSVSYHPLRFAVYGRRRLACPRCSRPLQESRLGNRSTIWCPHCQV